MTSVLAKRGWVRLGVFCLVSSWAASALAGPRDVRLLPAEIEPVRAPEAPDGPARAGALQPARTLPPNLEPVAQRLEVALHDALLDFGLSPLAALPDPAARDEEGLVALARDSWVVSPELSVQGNDVHLRLSVVAQGSSIVLVRAQRFDPAQLEVRSLGMLRELLEQPASLPREAPPAAEREAEAVSLSVPPVRSTGRVVLALNSAVLGGYVGYSLQRASGSNDARLTYPLAALGAGIGLGAAMVVADEWDITLARAWFLGAAMLWTPIGISLASTREGPDKHLLGVIGAVSGLTLATVGLAFGNVDEGGAAFTHSGAVLGLVLGGLGEMIVLGDAQAKPTRGVGYGILAGVTLAGALATQIHTPSPTDMLSIDLSALLGGLAGAALGTPLLVSQDPSERRDRVWLTGVMVGTVAGGVVGYYITRREPAPAQPGAVSQPPASDALSVRFELGSPAAPLGFALSGEW